VDTLKEDVEKAEAGDLAAFGRLISRYQDAVYGVGVAVLGSFHDAQDMAQETFVQAWRELKSLRDPEKFPGWLCRIARNRCLDLLRKRPEKTLPHDAADPVVSSSTEPPPILEASERRDAVLQAIGRLSEPLRVPTTLFYINGYSEKDVSRMMERPVGTIKRRLHDARQQLRKELMNMVESELKDSRPGPQLADHVLRRIRQVRVRVSRGQAQFLMLTDSGGRSFPIIIGGYEARALQPWLAGAASAEALDIHTACVRALKTFGCPVAKVTVSELKAATFYALLKVKSREGAVEIDCRPSDALNFAVRAKAPIFAENSVVEQCMLKDKDGRPMSPEASWRNYQAGGLVATFRSLSDIYKSLAKDPENIPARQALAGFRPVKAPKVKPGQKTASASWKTLVVRRLAGLKPAEIERLADWAGKCAGTKLEGVAAGLSGAVYLMQRQPKSQEEAIPLLEKARKLQPEDKRIAFDLATAYAMKGRTEDALSVLPKEEYAAARSCENFRTLWHDARFRAAVGNPEEARRNDFVCAQLYFGCPPSAGPISPQKDVMKWPEPQLRKDVRKLGKLGRAHTRRIEQLLGHGRLLGVILAAGRFRETENRQRLILGTELDSAAVLELDPMDFGNIDRALQQFRAPRPMTNESFCNVLRAASIQIEAVVLNKGGRNGIEAALVASRDGRREAIMLDGPAALSIAFEARRPVLIAETLAERLYLKDKTGEPLSTKAVIRRLCTK
jgi:RNA polymerase sigma-70 factor (ECF subfamily)